MERPIVRPKPPDDRCVKLTDFVGHDWRWMGGMNWGSQAILGIKLRLDAVFELPTYGIEIDFHLGSSVRLNAWIVVKILQIIRRKICLLRLECRI